jgi:hypothetical protein
MAVGLSTPNTANPWLNVLRGGGVGVTFTAPAVQAVRLYVGEPGIAGVNNAAAGDTTRKEITFGPAASGSMSMSSTPPVWTNGGVNEILTHIGVWSATSAGNFQYCAALTVAQPWNTGNTFTLSSLVVSFTSLATG